MAAEKENLGWPASPRLSFSHDLSQSDLTPTAIVPQSDGFLLLDSHFDFSVSCEISAEEPPSSADELFSDGKLLPIPIKQSSGHRPSTSAPPPPKPLPPPPPPVLELQKKRESLREVMLASPQELAEDGGDEDDRGVGKRISGHQRRFWRFGRSSSLGGGRPKSGTTCPFPLSRSKSTGSNPNPKPTTKIRQFSKTTTTTSDNDNNIKNNNNSKSFSFRKSLIDSSSKAYYYSSSRRGAYGNGLRISPVLNVPAPYLFTRVNGGTNTSNSGSVFGYLLCSCSSSKGMKKRSEVSCSPSIEE